MYKCGVKLGLLHSECTTRACYISLEYGIEENKLINSY
jgi:hypothetical protein